MTWNYRIIKHDLDGTGNDYYGLHEVYYNDKNKVYSWTQDAILISDEVDVAEAVHGIREQLKRALNDTGSYEVLIESTIKGKNKDKED